MQTIRHLPLLWCTSILVTTSCLLGLCVASDTATAADSSFESGYRVVEQLKHLATFTDDPNPAVTRILFTENDLKARSYVKHLMSEAGLTISQDLLGNIYGTLPGSNPSAPAIATGSHIDAIPLAGMYDGTTGVIGGIEALRRLKQSGFQPAVPLQVIAFTSEEPTRFSLSCLGSRAMAGVLTIDAFRALRDENGTGVLEAAQAAGCTAESDLEYDVLRSARVTKEKLGGFIELHIEQGPELEAEGLQIGIVTAIAAPAALVITFSGDGGHAGAHLMFRRNDASLAAAELALHVEAAALGTGAIDTVATTGRWEIGPNAVNSVPRDATLYIDVRDINEERRNNVLDSITQAAEKIAAKRKVRWTMEVTNKDPPATCDGTIIDVIEAQVKERGYSYKKMVSRAYHDSLFMAQIAPTAMIFIPCEGGKSHRPDEFASPEDIARGVEVLAASMAALAGNGGTEESKNKRDGSEL